MNILCWRLLPYIICITSGILVFNLVEETSSQNLKIMILGMSTSLISLPIVFMCYELVKYFANRKIRKEIREYIKIHTGKSLFALLRYFYCGFFQTTKELIILNPENVAILFSLNKEALERFFYENKLLGFTIYKNIDLDLIDLYNMVRSNNLTSHISNNEMLLFINILKNLDIVRKLTINFISEETSHNFKIERDRHPNNPQLELYYKDIRIDYGMFNDAKDDRLLKYYKVPTEMIEDLSTKIAIILYNTKKLIEKLDINFWNSNDYL